LDPVTTAVLMSSLAMASPVWRRSLRRNITGAPRPVIAAHAPKARFSFCNDTDRPAVIAGTAPSR